MALGLLAIFCSDPAIAAMLCPRAIACARHERTVQAETPTASLVSIVTTQSCCPLHREGPAQMPVDPTNCCAWNASDSSVPTPSFTSKQSRDSDQPAQLPSGLSAFIALQPEPSLGPDDSGILHVKPVSQKKTDLRI
jgi:hypothetical protein